MIREEAAGIRNDATPRATPAIASREPAPAALVAPSERREWTLDELSAPAIAAFAEHAYVALLGRLPTPGEDQAMQAALRNGDTKTWLLGQLRFGREGRARAVPVRGLRSRYLVQRLFRLPVVGPLAEWANAIARLPRSLRYLRAIEQNLSARAGVLDERMAGISGRMAGADERLDALGERASGQATRLTALDEHAAALRSDLERLQTAVAHADSRATAFEADVGALRSALSDAAAELTRTQADVAQNRAELLALLERLAAIEAQAAQMRATHRAEDEALQARITTLQAAQTATEAGAHQFAAGLRQVDEHLRRIDAPVASDSLEIEGRPLLPTARLRTGLAADVPVEALSADQRYALFEAVFYESEAVLAKQRIYLPYLDRSLPAAQPFLDLGCGRGEFMQILRENGIPSVGVDLNGAVVERLQAQGFAAVQRDLVDFLRDDRGQYCGAAALQVVEHLTAAQLEAMLVLVYPRLARGAVLILETPNPLSPFALGHFHMDPTHIAPLPPERLRFAVEMAGFEATRTLYQARIPGNQFAGPDPVAQYVDYAIIAYKRT